MELNEEITRFLNQTLNDDENKQRNVDIVMHRLGFSGAELPTLAETANRFSGIQTRERIRQIVKDRFWDKVAAPDLPSLIAVRNILHERPFWHLSEFVAKIVDSRLLTRPFSAKGLFDLSDRLGIVMGYGLYASDLKPVVRGRGGYDLEAVLVEDDFHKLLRQEYDRVVKLPGQSGVANTDQWESRHSDNMYLKSVVETLIELDHNSWTFREDTVFWFMFDNKENRLINDSAKVFSVIECADPARLAAVFRNALDSRSLKRGYPPPQIIEKMLRESTLFECVNGELYFRGKIKEIVQMESDVVHFLSEYGKASYPVLRDYLSRRGYGDPLIGKKVFYSPIVHVDKTGGRGNYEFSLVGAIRGSDDTSNVESTNDARYDVFRRRLARLDSTDAQREQLVRREQRILAEWLFDGKEQEACGMCADSYSVVALHAAHKKRRSYCNPAERRDPHIVMPMCVFGCDFLYERGHIYVKGGTIVAGIPIEHDGPEKDRVARVINRKVDERWLQGPEAYFKKRTNKRPVEPV